MTKTCILIFSILLVITPFTTSAQKDAVTAGEEYGSGGSEASKEDVKDQKDKSMWDRMKDLGRQLERFGNEIIEGIKGLIRQGEKGTVNKRQAEQLEELEKEEQKQQRKEEQEQQK